MANSFSFKSNSLIDGLTKLEKKQIAIYERAQTEATKIEDYAKKNAPWKDDTTRARKSLNASVSATDKGYRITLAHGVDYGIWLELAHEKRYAIIMPTIKTKGPDVIKDFSGFLEKLSERT